MHVLTFSAADFNPNGFSNAISGWTWGQDPDGLLRGNAAAFITFHAPVGLPAGATVKKITWHTNANAGIPLDFVRYRPKTQTATSIATTMTAGSTGIGEFSVTTDHTIEAGASYVLKAGPFFGSAGFYGATVEYVLPPVGFIPLPAAVRDLNTRDTGAPARLTHGSNS